MSDFSDKLFFTNTEQRLTEVIGEFLDSIQADEVIAELTDPAPRNKTHLHIRMAKAAMEEYKKTMISTVTV